MIKSDRRLEQQMFPLRFDRYRDRIDAIPDLEQGIRELHEGEEGFVADFPVKVGVDDAAALNVDFPRGMALLRGHRDENIAAIEAKKLDQILELEVNERIGFRLRGGWSGGGRRLRLLAPGEIAPDFFDEPRSLKRPFPEQNHPKLLGLLAGSGGAISRHEDAADAGMGTVD